MFAKYKNQITAILLIAVIAGVAFGSYQLGTLRPKNIIVKGVDNVQNGEINNVNFGIYWQVWELLKENHLKADEIDNQELIYGSASGLTSALDDPYTVFLRPDDAKQFKDDISGVFSGIGAEIGVRGDYIVVVSPLKDSPAEKAGLKAGDKILAVDDKSTGNKNLDEVVKNIRGPRGTEVTLTVLSNGASKPKEIKIIRDTIKIPTVKWEIKEGNVAYLQMFNFNGKSNRIFANAVNKALQAGAQGLVIDLRNNPGGFLEMAVSIAGIFVESGKEVVAEEFASDKRNSFKTDGDAALKDFPLVILVNKGSASASEILAGALRHYTDAEIIGEQTFGKGTVQVLKQLSDDSTLKITVAHWVLPNGIIIEGNGIEPDIEVEITEDDIKNKRDPQLEKALEVIKGKMNL